jgi:hypothetical protein
MMLSELAFYNLTDEEFYKETGAWIYNSVNHYLMSPEIYLRILLKVQIK